MKIIIRQATAVTTFEFTTMLGRNSLKYIPVVPEKLLNWLFYELNRSDRENMIHLLGMPIPSLSVGDIVEIDGRSFRCEIVGWREILP